MPQYQTKTFHHWDKSILDQTIFKQKTFLDQSILDKTIFGQNIFRQKHFTTMLDKTFCQNIKKKLFPKLPLFL